MSSSTSSLHSPYFIRGGVAHVLQTVTRPREASLAVYHHNSSVCQALAKTHRLFQNSPENTEAPSDVEAEEQFINCLFVKIPNEKGTALANNYSIIAWVQSVFQRFPWALILNTPSVAPAFFTQIKSLLNPHLLKPLSSLVLGYLGSTFFEKPSSVVSAILLSPKENPKISLTFSRTISGSSFHFTHESLSISSEMPFQSSNSPAESATHSLRPAFTDVSIVPHTFNLNSVPTDISPQFFTRRVATNVTTGATETLLIQWHVIAVDADELTTADNIDAFGFRIDLLKDRLKATS
jgi:hypothetical protein